MKGLLHLYFVLCFLLILSFNSSAPTKLCPRVQSLALLLFNNSLSIDCSASKYSCLEYRKKTIQWKEGTSCCLWDGVKCETETGNVIGLDLSCSCLHGTIPSNSSLFLLHQLQHLDLAGNDFTGTIPIEISYLSRLLSLDLSFNFGLTFEGHVFEKVLGNLTQLQHLLLPYVNMSSVVPTSFLNMSSYITTLTLETNGLQGKFPVDVFHFQCLQKFESIGNGDLEINFPNSNWSAPLRSLQVSGLSSLGEFPDSIGNLRSLEVLDLSSCHLKGSIPATLGNLNKLFYLSLGGNLFSGPLPFSAISNLTQLEYLDFSENQFVGPLPYHVSGLSRVHELRLGSNFLSGKVPSWLFSLPSLVQLSLNNNKFNGPVEQFDEAAPLERVYLRNNEMHGPIPSFSKLVNLTVLDLSSNKLNGTFELDKKLDKLEELHLSNNTFISLRSGSNANYSLPSLQFLNLSSCNIIEVPDVLRNLPGLLTLDLSHNSAVSFSNNSNLSLVPPNLTVLKLSSCNLTQFPNFLTTLDRLTTLDLSNNVIQGKISKEEIKWGKNLKVLDISRNSLNVLEYYPWMNINSLDLGSNLLEGPLLVPPPSTQHFVISFNKMVGEIPSSICYLESMQILDLSHNNLSGAIPECLNSGDRRLLVLDLHRNKFHGNIPNIFPEGNKLRTLNLNHNGFDGPLPKSLVNCHDLEVLNLAYNKFSDTFPHWLGTLPKLQLLDLRANYFRG
ncbi:hypothetical protein PTKIN_Ptkin14bG0173000 [Pterospermum kingtungense]